MPDRRLLVFIDLIQDVDVLLPVLLDAREAGGWRVTTLVSRWLNTASPRTETLLRRHGLPFRWVFRRAVITNRSPLRLHHYHALLTAAESTSETHVAGHALADRARRAGVTTFTLQHGFENVGLRSGADGTFARFASDWIFTWRRDERENLPHETFAKLVPITRPQAPLTSPKALHWDVAVFENLHAAEYTQADRMAFVTGLRTLHAEVPHLRVHVRPHPAGGWLHGAIPDLVGMAGLEVATPQRVREDAASGRDIASAAARIITMPSTIALDAATLPRPVAVVGDAAETWSPLRRLLSPADWVNFAIATPDLSASTAFTTRVLRRSDAGEHLLTALAGRLPT